MNNDKWRRDVDRDARRLKDAEHGRQSLLAQTVFLGTLSVLFLVPPVGGAYPAAGWTAWARVTPCAGR